MKIFKIKSFCKINLTLKVIKKIRNGYHNISSIVTFCDIHDLISVQTTQGSKDKLFFYGKFKKGINIKLNTVTKLLSLLRKKKFFINKRFRISIKKNIPHGSGLGGGSSNAANLLNFFNNKMRLRLNKKEMFKIASKIGFDVPISLERKNTFLTEKCNKMIRISKKFGLNILIIYPNIVCSTKKIYSKNKKFTTTQAKLRNHFKNKNHLISYLQRENNDLEKTVVGFYPKIKKIINFIQSQKGCYFSRITGSGSACIGIFSNTKAALYAQKLIKLKFPTYWCVVSKTI